MATAQITGFEVYESNIITARLTGFEVFGTPTTATAQLTGFEVFEPVAGPTAQLSGFEVFGTNTVLAAVLSGPATVEPDDLASFSLASSSGSPSSWSIVQTSGPAFTPVDANGSVTRRFRAPFVEPVTETLTLTPPYTTNPIYAVFTGTIDGTATSTWQVQVYPHTLWGTENGAKVPELWWEGDPVATPVASFAWSAGPGVAPATVAFRDMSSPTPSEWLWDFGDGQTSPEQNPTHVYTQAGQFTASLRVALPGSADSDAYTQRIVVSAPTTTPPVTPKPVVGFTVTPSSGTVPLTVTVASTANGSPFAWSWNWGDGTPDATTQTATHTYNSNGEFVITHTATNSAGTGAPAYNTVQASVVSSMPTTPAPGWKFLMVDDFTEPTAMGSWTNTSSWDLPSSNPYYRRWRSNPVGQISSVGKSVDWPTKTVDTVASVGDANGVYRIYGHTETVTYTYNGVTKTAPMPLAGGLWALPYPDATVRNQKLAMTPGKRITVRYKTVDGQGYGMAFFLWPVTREGETDYQAWVRGGEVDYPEHDWQGKIGGFVHTVGNPQVNAAIITTNVDADSGFHTATIEWVPGSLKLFLDGVLLRTVTGANVPPDDCRWGFQAGSHSTQNAPDPSVTGYLLVDWVTIEELDSNPAPTTTQVRFPDDEDMDSAVNRWQSTSNQQQTAAPLSFGTGTVTTTTDQFTHVHYWAPAAAVGNVVTPTLWVGTTVVATGPDVALVAGDNLMPVTAYTPNVGQFVVGGVTQATGTAYYQVASTAFAQGAVAAVGPMHVSGVASPARFLNGALTAPTGTSTSYRRVGPVQAVAGKVLRPVKKRTTSPLLRSGGSTVKFTGANAYDLVVTDNAPTSSGTAALLPMSTVNAVLDAVVAMGHNAVRIHSLFINYGKPGTTMTSTGQYNEAVLVQADKVLAACRARGLWVMAPLTDRWAFYHGGSVSFTNMVLGGSRDDDVARQIFYGTAGTTTEIQQVEDAFTAYCTTLANRVNTETGIRWRDDITLAVIETGNEIWDVPQARSDKLFTLIRSLFPGRLSADGSAASGETQFTKFHTSTMSEDNAACDIVGAHYYDDHRADVTQLQQQVAWAAAKNKAFVAGEYDWRNNSQGTPYSPAVQNTGTSRAQWLAALEANGQGDFWWSALGAGNVGHDDGYQLRVDAPVNSEQTAGKAAFTAHAAVMKA